MTIAVENSRALPHIQSEDFINIKRKLQIDEF